LILAPEGKILLSTIDENEPFIDELLGAKRRAFRPSIPNLVYQYSLYSNYESEGLLQKNPEIPDFD
jgi:EEF1A lysine methyltransferase 1